VFALADDLRQTQPGAPPDPDPLANIGRGWKLWDPDQRGRPGTVAEPPPLTDPNEDQEP
jgi:hypothetical protein